MPQTECFCKLNNRQRSLYINARDSLQDGTKTDSYRLFFYSILIHFYLRIIKKANRKNPPHTHSKVHYLYRPTHWQYLHCRPNWLKGWHQSITATLQSQGRSSWAVSEVGFILLLMDVAKKDLKWSLQEVYHAEQLHFGHKTQCGITQHCSVFKNTQIPNKRSFKRFLIALKYASLHIPL